MKTTCINYATVATLFAAAHMLAPIDAHAAIKVIAVAGDHAPDGNGVFSRFDPPIVNDAGQVVFLGDLVGTRDGQGDNVGIFMSDGNTLTQVVRSGQMLPDGGGSFLLLPVALGIIALNAAGQAAFLAPFALTAGGSAFGLFLSSRSSRTLAQIVRQGQAAPDGNGVFDTTNIGLLSLNDSGQVAFFDGLANTSGGASAAGIFRGDGSTLTQIARGHPAASDVGSLTIAGQRVVENNDGLIAFQAIFGTATGFYTGVVLSDGTTQTLVARSGGPTPDGAGTFFRFDPLLFLNDQGQLAFSAQVNGPTGSFTGIYFRTGTALTEVGRFRPLSMSLNNAGQLAVTSADTAAGGISKLDTTSKTEALVVSVHQAAPDGNGVLALLVGSTPSPVTINDVGQIAFSSLLAGGSPPFLNDIGVFLYDDAFGLIQVARTNDAFLGSTITTVAFQSGNPEHGSNALNNSGQVAFGFRLQDGRTGVALASAPTPLCAGDCDGSGTVTVNEIITLVNIALGNAQPTACPHGVPSGAQVDIALIIQAVNNALNGGCG